MASRPGTDITQFGDELNTTTSPLAANATYTGTFHQSNHPDVMVSLHTDVAGTLYFDYSDDNIYFVTEPAAGYPVTAGAHEVHTALKGPRFFRVRMVNESDAQTYMRLYAYHGNYQRVSEDVGCGGAVAVFDASAVITDPIDSSHKLRLVLSHKDRSEYVVPVSVDTNDREVLDAILHQLRLLNTRFEEAFRTGITTKDTDNGSY